MTGLRFTLVAAIAAVTACSAGAALAVTAAPPVWQGTAIVTALTDVTTNACENAGYGVGNYYTMIYREDYQSDNQNYGGGVQFATERSSNSYVMPASQNLPSGTTDNEPSVAAFGQSSRVGYFGYTGAFDLTISSTSSGTAPNVTINGTVADFFGNTGCTVTIEASLALRP